MSRRFAAARAVMLAALCAGCSNGDDDRVVTLQFWAMGREGEVAQALVRDFDRAHPGIRVDVQQIPWTAAHEKLLTAHVGGATPDLAQLGNTWIPEFVALNSILPLDSLVGVSPAMGPDDFFPGIWMTNVVDGSVYGIPWYVDTRVIFYREDLLARAGYDSIPATWEGWRKAMERVKEIVGPDRYAILLPTNEWAQPVILGMQAGSPLLREGGRYGAFEGPEFRRAFSFYVGLFRDGLAPVVSNTQMSNLYQEFARGRFAMYITGPWNLGEFERRLPDEMQDDWATAPLPGPTGAASGVSLAGGSSLVIFRDSENTEAAWALVEYLSQPEQQLRFYELTGNLPARSDAWQDTLLADPRIRAFGEQLQRVEPLPQVPEIELIVSKVYEHAEAATRGTASIDEALAALDRDVDRILEKRRWILAREASRDSAAGLEATDQ